MKRIIFLLALSFITSISYAQSDVLFLKNGSIIKGSVQEMDPSNGIKIQTSDGSVFVYSMADVDHVSKDSKTLNGVPSVNLYGEIERYKSEFRWKGTHKFLTEEEYSSIFNEDLYDTFKGAHKQFNVGRTFMTLGLGCLVVTCLSLYGASQDDTKQAAEEDLAIAQLFAYGADIGICLGCIFKGIGKGRLNWIENTYNSGKSYSTKLEISPSLMMTAQRDFGFGASISISF